MRKRTLIKPGLPGNRAVKMYHSVSSDTEPTSHTGEVPAEPPVLVSYLEDEPKVKDLEAVSRPVVHHKVRTAIGGVMNPVDPSFGTYKFMPYTIFRGPLVAGDSTAEIVPTMSVMGLAYELFPELKSSVIDHRMHLSFLEKEIGYSEWHKKSWKRPKVSLTADFNIVNFLLELRESTKLVASWLAKKALLKRWHNLMGINKSLSARAKAAADERLAHVYGTRLFLSDARSLFLLMVRWKHYADVFLSRAGLIQRKYKTPFYQSETWTGPVRAFPIFGISDSACRIEYSLELRAHNVMYYIYHVEAVRGFLSRLGQLCDTFGIKLDLGIAWDAIPFSFVVDWFINVSEWLHANVSRDWTRVDLVLGPATKSGKVELRKVLRHGYINGGVFVDSSTLIDITDTYYERKQVEAPEFERVDLEFEGSKKWRLGRIINASSLTAQKGLKHHGDTPLWFNYRGATRKAARQFRTKFRLM